MLTLILGLKGFVVVVWLWSWIKPFVADHHFYMTAMWKYACARSALYSHLATSMCTGYKPMHVWYSELSNTYAFSQTFALSILYISWFAQANNPMPVRPYHLSHPPSSQPLSPESRSSNATQETSWYSHIGCKMARGFCRVHASIARAFLESCLLSLRLAMRY